MITREHILEEIKRTTIENAGVPLGKKQFERETGIKPYDWGRYWARLGDAQKEAGFEPNIATQAIPDEALLASLGVLTRELGKRPTFAEIRVKRRNDAPFPSPETVLGRFGNFQTVTRRLAEFCRSNNEFADVAAMLPNPDELKSPEVTDRIQAEGARFGYVYMLKFRRNDYKIGASNDPDRRFGEIATKMPEPPVQIHTIKTDDPFGVEAYWHRRFASKQMDKNSEWFQLSPADVRAFRRWTKIF